ncbi:hypothetical protein [Devosia faecipullorum]|uniref:hypothetical protein n=1 Tax=Devosia faecipullorum TaxID=2755039 RepID=UPI00187B1760|nr:hypothetical protein [Devosia faecipullorum]MBE7732273.1 hypothetical protein [Devosia faecipullorum]
MLIDRRRIVNGLAWAGAALIVAVPVADLIARQFASAPEPQVAIVQEAPESAVTLPTPTVERPEPRPVPPAQPADKAKPARTADMAATAGDAVDSYLQSGRPLPSYISNGSGSTPPASGNAQPRPSVTQPLPEPAPAPNPVPKADAAPQPEAQPTRPVIAMPRAVTGFPTPVSERPRVAAAPATPVVPIAPANPPLIIEDAGPVTTAQDLDDWETGPLSDFLANRGGQRAAPAPNDYEPGGFWLDQGPGNGGNRRLPPAYDDDYYYYQFGQ